MSLSSSLLFFFANSSGFSFKIAKVFNQLRFCHQAKLFKPHETSSNASQPQGKTEGGTKVRIPDPVIVESGEECLGSLCTVSHKASFHLQSTPGGDYTESFITQRSRAGC